MFTISEVIAAAREFVEPDLLELIAIGEGMTTPDGRWEAVQDWLKRNKKWRKRVEQWFELEPRVAYEQIREAIISESETPRFFEMIIKRVISPDAEARIIKNIENLQTLYKERKGERKQINAGTGSKQRRASSKTGGKTRAAK